MGVELNIITEIEVAETFGISIKTLRNWATLGYGPTRVVVGRNAFYGAPEVRAWFQKLTAQAAANMKAKRGDHSSEGGRPAA